LKADLKKERVQDNIIWWHLISKKNFSQFLTLMNEPSSKNVATYFQNEIPLINNQPLSSPKEKKLLVPKYPDKYLNFYSTKSIFE